MNFCQYIKLKKNLIGNICLLVIYFLLVSGMITTLCLGIAYTISYREMRQEYVNDKMGYCKIVNETINILANGYWTVEVSPTPIFDKHCFLDSWPILTRIYFHKHIDTYQIGSVYPCWYDSDNHYNGKWTKFDTDELGERFGSMAICWIFFVPLTFASCFVSIFVFIWLYRLQKSYETVIPAPQNNL